MATSTHAPGPARPVGMGPIRILEKRVPDFLELSVHCLIPSHMPPLSLSNPHQAVGSPRAGTMHSSL